MLDLQTSSDPPPSGSCMVACVKWTGGRNPVPIRQMSTSQREHHTQQPTWQRGTGLGMGTAWTCSAQPGCLLSRTEASGRDEGRQYVSSSWRRTLCLLIHRTPYETPQSTSQTLSHLSYHRAMFSQSRFWLTEPHSGHLLRSPLGYWLQWGTDSCQGPWCSPVMGKHLGREGQERSPLTFLGYFAFLP